MTWTLRILLLAAAGAAVVLAGCIDNETIEVDTDGPADCFDALCVAVGTQGAEAYGGCDISGQSTVVCLQGIGTTTNGHASGLVATSGTGSSDGEVATTGTGRAGNGGEAVLATAGTGESHGTVATTGDGASDGAAATSARGSSQGLVSTTGSGDSRGSVATSGAGSSGGTVGTTGAGSSDGTVATSGVGDAGRSGGALVATTGGFGNAYGSVATAGAGNADGGLLAVSGTGNAQSATLGAAFGGPTASCQGIACHSIGTTGGANGWDTATSGTGAANSWWIATSGTSSANAAWIATSGAGPASGVVATSATGAATGVASTSGTGSATGTTTAASGIGRTHCAGPLACVAASATGYATCSASTCVVVSGCNSYMSQTGGRTEMCGVPGLRGDTAGASPDVAVVPVGGDGVFVRAGAHVVVLGNRQDPVVTQGVDAGLLPQSAVVPAAAPPSFGPDADGDGVPAWVAFPMTRATVPDASPATVQTEAAPPIVVALDLDDAPPQWQTERIHSTSVHAAERVVETPSNPPLLILEVRRNADDPSAIDVSITRPQDTGPLLAVERVAVGGLVAPMRIAVGEVAGSSVATPAASVEHELTQRSAPSKSEDPAWVATEGREGTLSETITLGVGSQTSRHVVDVPYAGQVLGTV